LARASQAAVLLSSPPESKMTARLCDGILSAILSVAPPVVERVECGAYRGWTHQNTEDRTSKRTSAKNRHALDATGPRHRRGGRSTDNQRLASTLGSILRGNPAPRALRRTLPSGHGHGRLTPYSAVCARSRGIPAG